VGTSPADVVRCLGRGRHDGLLLAPLASDAATATMMVLSISHLVAALIIVPALALTLSPK
jgi:hypothetical protein